MMKKYLDAGGNHLDCADVYAGGKAEEIIGSSLPQVNRDDVIVAGQYLYNLIHREAEREIIPAAVDHGLGILTYSPLGGGLLTGKYRGMTELVEGTRLSYRVHVDGPRFWHQRGFKTAEILDAVSSEAGIPASKLAIAWALKRRFVTSVIIGVKRQEQLEANLEIGDWDMPEDIWKVLEEKTRPEEEYLSWFNKTNYDRFFSAAEFHDETRELP